MRLQINSPNDFCSFKPAFEVIGVLKIPAILCIAFQLFNSSLLAATTTTPIKSEVSKSTHFEETYFEGVDHRAPWEYMGTDVTQICSAALEYYEWGVRYNNDGPILRVTCNSWSSGYRVCTYPEYPQTDTDPFTWGGACWIWGTSSVTDDACPSGYHLYFQQDANGRLNMLSGNGCNSLPSVYRRRY